MNVFLTTLYVYHLLKCTETINFVFILVIENIDRATSAKGQTLLLKIPKFLDELSKWTIHMSVQMDTSRAEDSAGMLVLLGFPQIYQTNLDCTI